MGSFNCKQVANVEKVVENVASVAVNHKKDVVKVLSELHAPPAVIIGTELTIVGIEAYNAAQQCTTIDQK